MEALPLDRHQKKVQHLTAHLAFLDESGFLLIPNVRRTWAPRGQIPIVWHRYRHDRISAISAVTVSFRRQRLGLYFHLHRENITQAEVVLFLRYLLRQIRGPIVLLWDGGGIHTGEETRVFLDRHPRLHVESFPAYAPELNPDERVWAHCKAVLANGRPDNLDELMATLERVTRTARRRPSLLRSFITGSRLPPLYAPVMSITYAQSNNARAQPRAQMGSLLGAPLGCRAPLDGYGQSSWKSVEASTTTAETGDAPPLGARGR